jgi:undecaprenyl-diphosphatase
VDHLAEIVARHAVAVLCVATLALLAATATFWTLINAHAPAVWRRAVQAWNALAATGLAARARRLPVLRHPVAGTLNAARFLGLFAVIAFLLAAAALALFVELADEIDADESLGRFDVALSNALRLHLPHDMLRFFSVITRLGDPEFLVALVAVVAFGLLVVRRGALAAAWIVATSSGALLNRVLKTWFERTRPFHDHGLASETSWSFPSGHASGSMLVYGLLCYLVVRHAPRAWHLPVALTSVALIVFVGSSRVLLQVHYLSDVLAGYASGAAWIAVWVAGLEAVRRRTGPVVQPARPGG